MRYILKTLRLAIAAMICLGVSAHAKHGGGHSFGHGWGANGHGFPRGGYGYGYSYPSGPYWPKTYWPEYYFPQYWNSRGYPVLPVAPVYQSLPPETHP